MGGLNIEGPGNHVNRADTHEARQSSWPVAIGMGLAKREVNHFNCGTPLSTTDQC